MVSAIYYLFWVRYHPSRVYSQKKSQLETKYRPPFPPTTKPHPLNTLDCGPTSLILVGYRLVVLQPLCACSIIFYFCLLSFARRFCHSRLAFFLFCCMSLYYFFMCFLLCFSLPLVWLFFPSCNSHCSLFLFIVLFHISFHTYPFIKKDLCLCGPYNVDWIKRVLGPICLDLLKPFY